MNNSKKIISLLLSLVMIMSVFSVVPVGVSAAEVNTATTGATIDEAYPDFKYYVLDDGTVEIIGYNGKGGDITIPSTLGGYTVTSIGERAFWNCKELKSVTIGNSVTRIGEGAFSGCSDLTSVTIPDSVTSIGDSAFCNCYFLTSVTLGNSVTSIGDWAFCRCTNLTSIDIPDSVTSIGSSAFSDCYWLTSVTIPDSVTSIGSWAFDATLWYMNQPDGLVYAGKVVYKMKGTCPTKVVIKNGTVGIAGHAFYGCTGLTRVTIPDSVTSIGMDAFSGCTGLTSVTIPDSVTSIGERAFQHCTGLRNVTIGNSVTNIGLSAFGDCTGLTSIAIPNSVTSIGEYAFVDCTGLQSVTIPDSVTSIGDFAFDNCTGLTSVTIPDSVTSIGGFAFFDCTGLTSVTIPNSVTSIDYQSFGYYDDWKAKKVGDFTIYGYEGSEAEKYAKDNEFTFVPLKDKADTTTGIILAVPEDTELTVKDITSEIICDLPDGCDKMTAYDISLTKDGETVQPGNIVTVKIPCSNENAKVYRFEANSTMTDMNAKYADGYMVFTTDHFSVYVLAEPKPEVVAVPGDVTGDGKTNVQDCTAILRYVRKLDTLTEDQLKRADVTGDGKVNVQDVTRILRHVRKIEALY